MRQFGLAASAALLATTAASTVAQAQILTPGAGTITLTGTQGPDGQESPVVEYDPSTQTTTSTVYENVKVSIPFSYDNAGVLGVFAGQVVSGAVSASAQTSQTFRLGSTTSATADGSGGFIVTGPTPLVPVATSEIEVSDVNFNETIGTQITGMLSQEITTVSTSGDTANLAFNSGSVTTSAIVYVSGTGKAVFDPNTGEVALSIDADADFTVLNSSGLATSGTVFADTVVAETDVVVGGQSVVGKFAALDAADAEEAALRIAGDAATLASANAYTDTSVATEARARIAGDAATLASANAYTDTSVAAEAKLRAEGDAKTLASANNYTDTSVASEARARIASDTALGNRISAEETARIAADTAERNARVAADLALDSRITNEINDRIAADNILRDKIASSTATAIALGGAVILPDVNFTLSGNVGFYEGAQAIAINASARVAPNTYVTGAFGGGLNKRGAVGGRVGVVFGF